MTSPEDPRPLIQASLKDYKGWTMIRLDFKYDTAIIEEIKAIRGRIWSGTNRCWMVPDTQENRRRFGISEFEQNPSIVKAGEVTIAYQSVCDSLLEQMREKILLRGYSPFTLKNYMNHLST